MMMKQVICLIALSALLTACGSPEAAPPAAIETASPTVESPAVVETTSEATLAPITEPENEPEPEYLEPTLEQPLEQPIEQSEQPVEEPTPDVQAAVCDPSYPDICVAPYPPDLNCSDISEKNFTVNQPDPHGFDRNKDGIGCESK